MRQPLQNRAPPAPKLAPKDYVDAKTAESRRQFELAEKLYRRVIAYGGCFRDSALKDLAGLLQTQKRTQEAIDLLESVPPSSANQGKPDRARSNLLHELYTALGNSGRNRDCARALLVQVSGLGDGDRSLGDFVIDKQTLPTLLRRANGVKDIRYFQGVPGPRAIVEFNSTSAAGRVIREFREQPVLHEDILVQVVWAPYETQFALDPEDIFPTEQIWNECINYLGDPIGKIVPPVGFSDFPPNKFSRD